MLKIDRHRVIEEELRTYGSILISEMSRKLNCSEETIRRDLKDLEASNKLKRIHGGAFIPESDDKGAPVHLRETFISKEKDKIAAYAMQNLITEHSTIMLDCSTTCLSLANQIFLYNLNVAVITNSLLIFNLFSKQSSSVKLISVGGTFHHKSNSFIGSQTINALSHYLADKCFISCPAIDINHGLLDNSSNQSEVRKKFIEHSRQTILIADNTKFSDTADYIITGIENVDAVVTNKKLSEAWEEKIYNNKIPLNYC